MSKGFNYSNRLRVVTGTFFFFWIFANLAVSDSEITMQTGKRGTGDNSPFFAGRMEPIPEHILSEIKKYTWNPACPTPPDDLCYLTLSHWNLDDQVQTGHLIVCQSLASEIIRIFEELFRKKFCIQSMRIMSEFQGNDFLSMENNNTSCFNCRKVLGNSEKYSKHSYGIAIDINPMINPYIKNGRIYPKTGRENVKRIKGRKGMIMKGGDCWQAFVRRGWKWGGDWKTLKDYHHFVKALETTKGRRFRLPEK